ncbi:hypothetical protein DY000_02023884 [Brassica cretica]|uniref:Protein kinase domain-containing protein n=1 Tax=Brassica cretica TaxID=69181 RepID=A0ABQ7E3E0_BRACR|nr:hypothetical protein DY000_02023884 [Brassica cretica]
MTCFSCLNPRTKDTRVDIDTTRYNSPYPTTDSSGSFIEPGGGAKSFTFKELATATRNFREVNLLGEGGFGRVYKGRLDSGQVVAIKQLNPDGLQGNREFIVEVLMLSLFHHPNLVTLIGYCTSGDQRLLVYEYMPMGSLKDHLFDLESNQEPLTWNTRMKIAVGDMTHVSTRVMGTYGYCAPEYAMSGKLTVKSDIYCFGVVLLELVTGRKAIDLRRKQGQQNLVAWSRPYLTDQKKFGHLVDPSLRGAYPRRCLNYAVAIIAMCLNEEAHYRPFIGDIVVALEYLAAQSQSLEARNVFST